MPAAVESAFDIALWFADTAAHNNEFMQPQKLHRLMFLAQAYFAVAYKRKLMPAVFVAEEMGPIEPNVYAVFSRGKPNIDPEIFLEPEVEMFLDSIWRRFGHHSPEHLNRLTRDSPAYQEAWKRGRRAEIPLAAMRRAFARAADAPHVDTVIRPKIMRTQDGKPVAVKSWSPGSRADARSAPLPPFGTPGAGGDKTTDGRKSPRLPSAGIDDMSTSDRNALVAELLKRRG